MTRVKLTSVRTFPGARPDKEQALKVVEESAEVFSAWEGWQTVEDEGVREMLLDEIADTIQACCNLAASLGVTDLTTYLARCEERNRRRGRYDE